jgi:tRNA-splicing ligase RtcB
MGDASYVVVGKGDPLALNSSPHGAGRAYSRSKARRTFTREQLRTAMKGIEFRNFRGDDNGGTAPTARNTYVL